MNLLYLVHRFPFPPNKGDKVRSYHLLRHLARKHQVFLGTFLDDAEDVQHIPTVNEWCADGCYVSLNPKVQTILSSLGFLTGEPLGLRFYRNAQMQSWVTNTIVSKRIDAVVVFSSVMAQFLERSSTESRLPLLADFVDVDSEKWCQYAQKHAWPISWVYAREGRKLLAYEKSVAARAVATSFATENEAELFRQLAPDCSDSVISVDNGVDADFYSPLLTYSSPYAADRVLAASKVIGFTGAMDYWPNVDAVCWFVNVVMPPLRVAFPGIRFYIVGRKPTASVLALATDDVVVTGTVDDVRPYIAFADLIVAPLRVARGIQNKILEAMAMARPVVAAKSCLAVIRGIDGVDFVGAESEEEYLVAITSLLNDAASATAMGERARNTVVTQYSWDAQLAKIDTRIDGIACS